MRCTLECRPVHGLSAPDTLQCRGATFGTRGEDWRFPMPGITCFAQYGGRSGQPMALDISALAAQPNSSYTGLPAWVACSTAKLTPR